MYELTHIDCFSGAGGICTGFKAAGIKTLLAIEKIKSCVDTYTANHPEVTVIHNDIRDVTTEHIQSHVPVVDIVTAGMPCETFSTAGSKSRSFYDERQTLYHEAIRIAVATQAKLILFENVRGITSKKIKKGSKRLVIEQIYDDLYRHGYQDHISITLNSSDFGVPQKRERFFILATNQPDLTLMVPKACHNGIVNVKQAFAGLPELHANEKRELTHYTQQTSKYVELLKHNQLWRLPSNEKLTYHISPNHRAQTLKRFALIEQGEGLKNLFFKYSPEEVKRLQKEKILPKRWYIQRNRRLISALPSVTVTSHCLDELLHPTLDRALTVREAARLQSFPDAYDFKGGPLICPHIYETQDKYEQIGDAVPPLLAYHWGMVVKKILRADSSQMLPNAPHTLSKKLNTSSRIYKQLSLF